MKKVRIISLMLLVAFATSSVAFAAQKKTRRPRFRGNIQPGAVYVFMAPDDYQFDVDAYCRLWMNPRMAIEGEIQTPMDPFFDPFMVNVNLLFSLTTARGYSFMGKTQVVAGIGLADILRLQVADDPMNPGTPLLDVNGAEVKAGITKQAKVAIDYRLLPILSLGVLAIYNLDTTSLYVGAGLTMWLL